jgi:hypothetical protein
MLRDTPAQILANANAFAANYELFHGVPSAKLPASLALLRQMLDAPGAKRDFSRVPGFTVYDRPRKLPDAVLTVVESLLTRVLDASGSGKLALEEGMLQHIALTASPTSLPLLERLLDYTRPRDQFAVKRRAWAVAGISLIATRTSGSNAAARRIKALLREHPDKRVRTAAVDAVGRLWRTQKGDLTAGAIKLLGEVSREDRAFEPCFAARGWLAAMGHAAEVPTDGGVYAFKATFGRASRTVELLATHTLVDLVSAVVGAFSWDHDHLWALALSIELDQDAFQVSPEGDPWNVDDGPAAMPIGTLGMPVGHRFRLLYDFGDHNLFDLELVDVRPSPTPRAKYPRVAASVGKAPEQYG